MLTRCGDFLAVVLAVQESKAIGVPYMSRSGPVRYNIQQTLGKGLPGETTASDVLIKLLLLGRIEEVLVAHKAHPVYMVIELVIIWILRKEGYRRGHFEEAVSQKLKALIILPHAPLKVNLLPPVVFRVVGVLGESLQSMSRIDDQA